MKICFISNLYPPFIIGGAEISGKQTVEGLEKRGYDVIVITTSPNRSGFMETKNGVKIYRIKSLNLYTLYNHQDQPEIIKPIWHMIDL
ncbi:hypothetical protein C5S31_05385 [ANME-1 cluster archaeon GoMg2]|nr:hypothetical protein [ANME-1 cluster archaeon GoMg2]